ncbi:MAG: IdeS/Mac family cysteine endopeptidase [Capnocytophaga sp.]|nr:IdeS/Mac family cysteine endopeptidase [Capnocytophaga sp.]
MKNILKITVSFISVLFFVGCTEQEKTLVETADVVPFSFSISDFKENTTTTTAKKTFIQGDKVMLYYGGKRTNHITDGTTWSPALKKSDVGNSATIIGIMPAQDVDFELYAFRFGVYPDQSIEENYTKSDLIVAKSEYSKNASITLNFKHLMSRVNVTLSGLENTATAKVEIRAYVDGQFDLEGDTSKELTEKEPQWITARKNEDGSFSVLVLPQNIAKFKENEGWIRITANGKTALFKAPELLDGKAFEKLQSGKQISVNLTITKTEQPTEPISEEFKNVTRWVHGVDISKSEKRNNGDYIWKEGCGWYDVDKQDTEVDLTGDRNMCWAAAASNLLHWWTEQHKENIAKYEEKSGKKWNDRKYHASQNSEIYNKMKSGGLGTGGGHTASLLNYYLSGVQYYGYEYREHIETSDLKKDKIEKGFAGFALPLMGEKPICLVKRYGTIRHTALRKEEFNNAVKEALTNKRAIGLSVPGHAINMWGADFGSDGYITHVYLVDNNYNHDIMLKVPVGYNGGLTYMPNSVGTLNVAINQLTTLDLGEDIWEEYFRKNP